MLRHENFSDFLRLSLKQKLKKVMFWHFFDFLKKLEIFLTNSTNKKKESWRSNYVGIEADIGALHS